MLIKFSTIDREDFNVIVDPARVRPTDITLQVPDWSKFNKHTGWKPTLQTEDICKDLLDYWRGEK
jgi:GDP-4-dehydro-6-deoxy-D-mannose reductase